MTDMGTEPWPTDATGPYSSQPTGRGSAMTTTTDAPPPPTTPPLVPPTVLTSPPIVISPEPTAALASPAAFAPPVAATPSERDTREDAYTTFGNPPAGHAPELASASTAPVHTAFGPPSPTPLPTSSPLVIPTPAFEPPPAPQPQQAPAVATFGSQPHPADQMIAAAARVQRWNWAAGSVIGLSILCLVFAVPRFAVAVDTSQMSQQQIGDWLLYGSALGSLLTVICLASRRVAVVAALSVATAAVAIAAVLKLQGDWNLSHNTTWASLGLVIGLAVLGLCSSLGLRRTS